MASRLDRLFTLLEQGQSIFLRKTAAYQIGEIIKTHPNELEHLLEKIRPLITNSSWDTRIAASQTIESIIKNLPSTHYISPETLLIEPEQLLSLDQFDLEKILSSGTKLLSSDTEKYDIKDEHLTSSNESIKNQKKLLYNKLGIDVSGAACLDTTNIFTDEDLINQTTTTTEIKTEPDSPTGKTSASTSKRTKETSEPSTKKLKSVKSESNNCIEVFTRWLLNNLFKAEWEDRHGSAATLRDLFKGIFAKNLLPIDNKIHQYLEDLISRLLVVISLDRFADYVGDEVVAPVRETCAQIISLLSLNITSHQLETMCSIINRLIRHKESWEVRHNGILILKYLIGVLEKNDAHLTMIIQHTFNQVIDCIKDDDDDVRQVASNALIPIAKRLHIIVADNKCQTLIQVLIEVLSTLDDLSTSCTSIMCLLCDLLVNETNSKFFWNLLNVNIILARLFPYLQHNNVIVKQTTLTALIMIFKVIPTKKLESIEKNENFVLLFRLLYQQSVIETDQKCRECISQLWYHLCGLISTDSLIAICFPYITTWLLLLMYPANSAIEAAYLVNVIKPSQQNASHLQTHQQTSFSQFNQQENDHAHHSGEGSKEYLGGLMSKYESAKKRDELVVNCRLLAARLLSILFNRINNQQSQSDANTHQKPIDLIVQFLSAQINYKSGLNRLCYGLLMIEWGQLVPHETPVNVSASLIKKIFECLDDANLYFDEIAVLFTRMQKDCKSLAQGLKSGYERRLKTRCPVMLSEAEIELVGKNIFTLEDAQALVAALKIHKMLMVNSAGSNVDEVNSCIHNLSELISRTANEQETLRLRSSSSLASASIALRSLTEKMNPLIRPLIDSIRAEINEQLQVVSCKHLAMLLKHCCSRTPNPVSKIFKNLVTSLCNDTVKTPLVAKQAHVVNVEEFSRGSIKEFYEVNRHFGIGSIAAFSVDESASHSAKLRRRVSNFNADSMPSTPSTPTTPVPQSPLPLPEQTDEVPIDDDALMKMAIEKRGAEFTFKAIASVYDDQIETVIPELIQVPLNTIEAFFQQHPKKSPEENMAYAAQISSSTEANLAKYQDLINSLQLMEYLCSCGSVFNNCYVKRYLENFDKLMRFINYPLSAVRLMVARCIAAICKKETEACMDILIEPLIECLANMIDLFSRQGAIELVYNLLDKLSYDIVPYTVILIVPVLKRMTDLDWYVRTTASYCFATLIKLYPLEKSQIQTLTKNENILRIQMEQKDFLEQLCDNKKVVNYTLDPKLIKTQLRSYQQAGVNWLAFLKRFNLHGILCDDMGLGKTLQSICILAGDHFEKMDTGGDWMPSLIVCPTTLTNHWAHEIKRFVDTKYLMPLIYCGSVNERENLRRLFHSKKYNILIVSYEIVRHDITFISSFNWNYCILDEGHLIKSTKTKLSKAIKQLNAAHRLILTGTPIQNNVYELWCLFDFLIPGYLGTEKQFHMKYGRFIAPQSTNFQKSFERSQSKIENGANGSNNGSSGSTDVHEMGLIALESLHKQVLPFVLRRTKDEVLKDLPPKIIQDYYCEMSSLQKELYQDFAKSQTINEGHPMKKAFLYEEDTMDDGSGEHEMEIQQGAQITEHIFQAIQYLRKVVNHPSLVLKPGHPKWTRLQSEYNLTGANIGDIKHSGKLLALRDLLYECGIGVESAENQSVINQHRVLIFCQLKSMIDIIERELLKSMENVSFLRLDGGVPPSERFGIVHRFNTDPSIDILMLTTQIGGLGLNLTGADTVIFYEHDWNPQKDLQAMDRAHRIGQTKIVNVYRLITKRTLEEKIMSLQKFKMGLANTVVNMENSSLQSMGTEQLLDLFNKENKANQSQASASGGTSADVNAEAATAKGAGGGHSYQRLIDNLSELWDETQYESEYNLDNFISSLNK